MKVVLFMFKGDAPRTFPIERDQTRLGRRQDCHLRIPTRDVSRIHCDLIKRDGKLFAKDLGSSNGTYINAKRIAEAELKAGDKLRVGPVIFYVQIDGKPPKIVPEPGAETPSATAAAAAAPTPVPAPVIAAPAPKPKEEKTMDLSDADFEDAEVIETLDDWEDEKDMP